MSDDLPFAVFSPDGTMQGNFTSIQGVAPNTTTPLPTLPQLPTLPGVANSATITPGQATGTPSAATSTTASVANNYFVRAVIIILGFIMVAVGLTMLGRQSTIVQGIKNNLPGR